MEITFVVPSLVFLSLGADNEYETNIRFIGIKRSGELYDSTFEAGHLAVHCDVTGKFAVLLHGYNEDCNHPYMVTLIENLRVRRGGCMICMDFSKYTKNSPYLKLIGQHDEILAVLTKKLHQFIVEGFEPKKGYMFGFSFGSILAINGALATFGSRVFGLIDACDPAGIFVDDTPIAPQDASQAAINVQCIHTSIKLGTKLRTCTQDWLMGVCGAHQFSLAPFQISHSMCPIYYNIAFTKTFAPIKRPPVCPNTPATVNTWPVGYKMGYDETRLEQSEQVFGTLHAKTSLWYPYNSA